MRAARTMDITGTVQGVGFRWTAKRIADHVGVSGWVRNNPDGSVTLTISGAETEMDEFMDRLEESMDGHVAEIKTRDVGPVDLPQGFAIIR